MSSYSNKKSPLSVVIGIFFIFIMGGLFFVLFSNKFEREKPNIIVDQKIYWNLKTPISVKIEDQSNIRSYKISLVWGDNMIPLKSEVGLNQNIVNTEVTFPAKTFYPKEKSILRIETVDSSLWNFMAGNLSIKEVELEIDRKDPNINIISKSYGIANGGSALVIFSVEDDNLKDFYIKTNDNTTFKSSPFLKEGYYISLIAKDIRDNEFNPYIVAIDKAGNDRKVKIQFFDKVRRYKESKINLNSNFLDGKISELYNDFIEETPTEDSIKKFIFVNETLREKSFRTIAENTKGVTSKTIENFDIKPFFPLKNGAAVASFGDHRFFYHDRSEVSQSYHFGLDLASFSMAPVYVSNPGVVVFADYNGIYGNMPIIDHGLGLFSIYGHSSELAVQKSDILNTGDLIVKTGVSGLALGDHLHFEMRVQGVPVRPEEWMDEKWIELNIDNIIKDAKKIIKAK